MSRQHKTAISRAGNNHFLAEHLKVIRNCIYRRPSYVDAPIAGPDSGTCGVSAQGCRLRASLAPGHRVGVAGAGCGQLLRGPCGSAAQAHGAFQLPYSKEIHSSSSGCPAGRLDPGGGHPAAPGLSHGLPGLQRAASPAWQGTSRGWWHLVALMPGGSIPGGRWG